MYVGRAAQAILASLAPEKTLEEMAAEDARMEADAAAYIVWRESRGERVELPAGRGCRQRGLRRSSSRCGRAGARGAWHRCAACGNVSAGRCGCDVWASGGRERARLVSDPWAMALAHITYKRDSHVNPRG